MAQTELGDPSQERAPRESELAGRAPLARFGTPLHWLRGRLKEDGPPNETPVNGIFPNAVWALQQRAFKSVLARVTANLAAWRSAPEGLAEDTPAG